MKRSCIKRRKTNWDRFKELVNGQKTPDDVLARAIENGNVALVKIALIFGADGKKALEESRARIKNRKIVEILQHAPVVQEASTLDIEMRNNPRDSIQKEQLRVLCLDGGGIRGLVQVIQLEAIQKKTGKHINQSFDWIVGTSTGGLLALNIMQGKSLRQCLIMYIELMDEVFTGTPPYDHEKLERFLKTHYGEGKMIEQPHCPRVMIPALQVSQKDECVGHLKLFRNYERPATQRQRQLDDANKQTPIGIQTVWLAARATSSVPLMIIPARDKPTKSGSRDRHRPVYFDGGLISNNPTLDVLTEIHNFSGQGMRLGIVVSVGTGRWKSSGAPRKVSSQRGSNLNPFNWCGNLRSCVSTLKVVFEQVGKSNGVVNAHARAMTEAMNAKHYRLTPKLETPVKLDCKDVNILIEMMWQTHLFINREKKDEIELIAVELLPI